ncbi:MAG: hypothetical protein V4505_14845 [Pseudomonadota bacterium]
MLTYAIQRVGYDYQQADAYGATDYDAFLRTVDGFPWAAQHAEWNQTQDGPLPAVVLQNGADQRALWVTALGMGERDDGYQLQSVAMRSHKGFFGKAKVEEDATVAEARDRAELGRLCRLFCDAQYAALDEEVARLVQRESDRD